MFGWRRRKDGFEWRKYVRTTILIRREKRRQRIDDARLAAIARMRDAGRKAVVAGAQGLKSGFDTAMAGIGAVVPSAKRAVDRVSPRVAAAAEQGKEWGRRAFAALPPIGSRELLLAAAAIVLLMVLRQVPFSALEINASAAPYVFVAAAILGVSVFLITGRPVRLYNEAVRLGCRISRLPGIDRVTPKSVAAATLATVVIGSGYLLWADANMGKATPPAAQRAAVAAPAKVTGRALVKSGDTLKFNTSMVRLAGIDAPDPAQQCAREGGKRWKCAESARQALARLVGSQVVNCDISGKDSSGMALANCYVQEKNLAEELVRGGHVFATGGIFSGYSGVERTARSAKAGIWAGEVERTSEFRAKRWEEAKRAAPDGCPIKGAVHSGSRIYLLPWSPRYEHAKVRTAKGERWFCSEQEAQAAGWRLSERS